MDEGISAVVCHVRCRHIAGSRLPRNTAKATIRRSSART